MDGRLTLVLAALLAALTAAPAAAAPLTLRAADVPGLRAAGSGARIARAALPGRPPASLRRVRAKGAAYAGAGRRLRVGVFVLASPARARRALRVVARRARVRVRGARIDAVVVRRSGRLVGVVRLIAPKRAGRAGVAFAARGYAAALVARLRRARLVSPWQRVLDALPADGSITPRIAARAFATLYGPVRRARQPTGRGRPESGTFAIQLVARAWSGLTPAQRAAVDRALGAPHDAASAAVARAAQETLTPAPDLQASADAFAGFYAQRLGVPAPQIRVFRTDTPIKVDSDGDGKADTEVAADALPLNAAGQWGIGTPAYCRVRFPPISHHLPTQTRNLHLAHEAFHCFQFALGPVWSTWPGWILEGTATWASIIATDLPKGAGVANYYGPYLHTIDKPLLGRAYDAAGFWARVDEVGGAGSLWAKLPAVLSTKTSADAFAAAGATARPFVDTWASSSFRFSGAGPAWYQRAPYPVPSQEIPTVSTIVLSGATLGSNPYSTQRYTVATDPSMPLVNVLRLAGSLRAGTNTKDLGLIDTGWYCYGSCACPAGETSSIPEHEVLDQTWLALGLTGGADKGAARVTYHALDEFCGPPSKALNVSGATTFSVVGPGYCVLPSPDVFQVQLPVSSGPTKIAQVVLEVNGFHGAGEYPTGPSVATVYDFRETSSSHLWETPSSGSITIANPGSPVGAGARGTVDSVTTGTSPELGGITTTVTVSGSWSCVGGAPPPQS